MGLGKYWRRRQCKPRRSGESQVKPLPTLHQILDIRVPDDGFTLTGRRYAEFHREVARRQKTGDAQDEVSVWFRLDSGQTYITGNPRINDADELEILDGETLIGTVRKVSGALYFYPVE